MDLCFPKLCELLAQVGGVFLETAEVKLHLQVVDAVQVGGIGRWRRHQGEGRQRRVSCQLKSGKRGSARGHRVRWKKKWLVFDQGRFKSGSIRVQIHTRTHTHTSIQLMLAGGNVSSCH